MINNSIYTWLSPGVPLVPIPLHLVIARCSISTNSITPDNRQVLHYQQFDLVMDLDQRVQDLIWRWSQGTSRAKPEMSAAAPVLEFDYTPGHRQVYH